MDRRGAGAGLWLAIAAAGAVIGAFAWYTASRPPAAPSSYSTGPAGMAALYRVLAREGVPVNRRTGPALPAGPGAILVGASAAAPFGGAQARALRAWVAAGNEAVLLGPIPALGPALHVAMLTAAPGGATAHAALALPTLRAAPEIRLPQAVVLEPLPRSGAAVLYTTALAEPVALEVPVGRGRVYWFGSAQAFANRTLAADPANLALAGALLDQGGPVTFDEYSFGAAEAPAPVQPRSATAALPAPRHWPAAVAGAALAAAAALWAAGWRRHPIRVEAPAPPTAAASIRAYAELLWRSGVPAPADGEDASGR